MAQPLTYTLNLANAGFVGPVNQSRAALKGLSSDASTTNAVVGGMKVKFDGLTTSTHSTAASMGGLLDKAAHLGGNIANVVSGVKAANEAINWFRNRNTTAATAVQAVTTATGAAAVQSKALGTGARVAGGAVGFMGAAAGGAAIGFTALAVAAGPIIVVLAAVQAAVAAFKVAAKGITLAAELEQTEVAFKAVAGSAEKGRAILAAVKQVSIETGTAFDDMSKASQKLISSRIPEGALSSEMKALSTIAKVTGGDLNGLARAYSQVAGTGRVQGDELEQFADQGAGAIKQEMADILGVSQATFRKMQEEGKVGFSVLQQAVQRLGGETGKWSSALKDSSTTTIGLLGLITSNVGQMLAAFGKPINDGPIKAILMGVERITSRMAAAVNAGMALVTAAIEQGKVGETLKNLLILGAKEGWNYAVQLAQQAITAMVGFIQTLPQRIMSAMETVAAAVKAAFSGSLSEVKSIIASFDTDSAMFDTTPQTKFLNDLMSKTKTSAGVLEQAAENWSKALDSTPDATTGKATKAKGAAGGDDDKVNPKAFRPDGTPRKLSASDRFYDDNFRRADGRRKIFGGISPESATGFSGLKELERLNFRQPVGRAGEPGFRGNGGPRMFEAFGPGLKEAAKKMQFPGLKAFEDAQKAKTAGIGPKGLVVPNKNLTTPGQATKREQREAAAQQQAKQQTQRWDLVAAIAADIKGLAVA